MAKNNGYASLVKQRAEGKTKRRKLDDYETPEDKTGYLIDCFPFRSKAILEPASGSGRMASVIKARGFKVTTADIKRGADFTRRTARFAGAIVTNPPYRDGLADAFVNKALQLADGEVAMLMEAKFMFGDKRNQSLYQRVPPSMVIVIPERIYFFEGKGKPITSQFFNHVWLCWPDRATRDAGGYKTEMVWVAPTFG
jgi:hypothetical protein